MNKDKKNLLLTITSSSNNEDVRIIKGGKIRFSFGKSYTEISFLENGMVEKRTYLERRAPERAQEIALYASIQAWVDDWNDLDDYC